MARYPRPVPLGDPEDRAVLEAALSHAGVSESSTKYCNAWLEYDDGRAECYEVEFMAGNTRYEYKIALTSATVLESERESYGGSGSSGQSTGQSGSQTSGGSGTSSTDIGAEKAKSIALNHAGVRAMDLRDEGGAGLGRRRSGV